MNDFWSRIFQLDDIEIFLIVSIALIIITILFFIILIILSRLKKSRHEIFKKKNTPHINKILFSIAFDGAQFEDIRKDPVFIRNWKRGFYRQQFLSELIKLHRLYGGEIAYHLRRCYTDFRLIQLSYAKIRSRKWEIKCAGIQELSEMEIKKAVPVILEHTKSENDTLKMVALIEVLHLSGLNGLSLLKDYQEPLNDWIQLNLLESIKESNKDHVPNFSYLLESNNETIVVFGLRLVKLFHQNQHLSAVNELTASPSRKIKVEAMDTYKHLSETTAETISNNGNESPNLPYNIIKPAEKESYDPYVLMIFIMSALLIFAVVIFHWLGVI